jgi:Peptidase C13 family
MYMAGAAAQRGTQGCLFYFTSHGNQQGIVFGRSGQMLDPGTLNNMVTHWCGARPTVVIISACYSGVFAYPLSGPNRMVMTAARPDRSSFGCGGNDRYPYFDDCVLNSLPRSVNMLHLADTTRQCVAEKEQQTGAQPPSEPQVLIGEQIRTTLGALPFVDASATAGS